MPQLSVDRQVELLMQGTAYGDEALRQAMAEELRQRLLEAEAEGRRLRVYCGFDPRTSDLHLGHTVPIRKMRQFQELGHEVIFVVGRFTSLIGDPSDQDQVRAQITLEQATANAETYAEQAFKILDPSRTRLEYNDSWLARIPLEEMVRLASLFTVQQFLTRETFRQRFDQGDPIYFHEFFYSILQGYDAYHLRADVQIGGSDQLFNIVTAARKLMEAQGARPNIGIILGILPGTDGVKKMSKSLGNHIPLLAAPEDMYGKVMSLPDQAMGDYFRLVTRWGPEKIAELEDELASGRLHPMDVKMQLAREIVAIYCGEEQAPAAERHFLTLHRERGVPEDLPQHRVPRGSSAVDVLVTTGLAPSRSEARRLVRQGAVRLNGVAVTDSDAPLEFAGQAVFAMGKRGIVRLVVEGAKGEAG